MLEVGTPAPSFELKDQNNAIVSNETLAGKNALIVFVPFAFSPVCTGEMCEISENMSELESLNANVVIISVDSGFSNAAWAASENISTPVLADFWPHGEVAKAFGNFNDELGCANRTTFVLDASGNIAEVIPAEALGTARDFDTYKKALANI